MFGNLKVQLSGTVYGKVKTQYVKHINPCVILKIKKKKRTKILFSQKLPFDTFQT